MFGLIGFAYVLRVRDSHFLRFRFPRLPKFHHCKIPCFMNTLRKDNCCGPTQNYKMFNNRTFFWNIFDLIGLANDLRVRDFHFLFFEFSDFRNVPRFHHYKIPFVMNTVWKDYCFWPKQIIPRYQNFKIPKKSVMFFSRCRYHISKVPFMFW